MSALREQFEQYEQIGVFEPRTRERAERRLVLGQFADDVGLGARMRQDVEKVVYDHRKVGVVNAAYVLDELAPRLGTHQLVEGPPVTLAARS